MSQPTTTTAPSPDELRRLARALRCELGRLDAAAQGRLSPAEAARAMARLRATVLQWGTEQDKAA